MPAFSFFNDINTTLGAALTSTATTLILAGTAGLPTSVPSGTVFALTLNDAATRSNFEVVYVTAITGSTLTVERAQEGTRALSWLIGDYAYSGVTAGQMNAVAQTEASNTFTENNTFSEPVVIAPSSTGSMMEAVNQGQFSSSLTTNGWKKYPDPNSPSGYFIEQWGLAGTSNGFVLVSFPIAFPNAVFAVVANIANTGPGGNFGSIQVGPISAAEAQFYSASFGTSNGGPANSNYAFYWMAKGY